MAWMFLFGMRGGCGGAVERLDGSRGRDVMGGGGEREGIAPEGRGGVR